MNSFIRYIIYCILSFLIASVTFYITSNWLTATAAASITFLIIIIWHLVKYNTNASFMYKNSPLAFIKISNKGKVSYHKKALQLLQCNTLPLQKSKELFANLIPNTSNVLCINNTYIKYKIEKTKSNDIVIWLMDYTENKAQENEITSLMHKYRHMSFELDNIFNSLPIPIWQRDENLNIIYYNNSYSDLLDSPKDGECIEIDTVIKLKAQSKIPYIIKRHFLSHTQQYYRVSENITANQNSSIGYCLAIDSNTEEKSKNNKSLLRELLNTNTQAVITIDKNGKVNIFNDCFCKMFNIDKNWLLKHPYFTDVLGQISSNNSDDFKSTHLSYLKSSKTRNDFISHMHDGRTIHTLITRNKNADTILIHNDLTSILKEKRKNI